MSTVSSTPNGTLVAAAKGAPETIKGMLEHIPAGYDDTYKWFTRRGSRVLALGIKNMEPLSGDKVTRKFSSLATMPANADNLHAPRSTNWQERK
jgi:manganese-transporting P-type ATPase